MTKSDYKKIFEKAQEFVNKWDPCSFIESGAPIDEYDSLTNKILSGAINQRETENLKSDIIDLLDNFYGTPVFDELTSEKKDLLINETKEVIEKIKKLMPTKPIRNAG